MLIMYFFFKNVLKNSSWYVKNYSVYEKNRYHNIYIKNENFKTLNIYMQNVLDVYKKYIIVYKKSRQRIHFEKHVNDVFRKWWRNRENRKEKTNREKQNKWVSELEPRASEFFVPGLKGLVPYRLCKLHHICL